ncbi:RRM domain-containing protein [Mycena venus]|uniref:RRM domain-containing protein n=1 Tax=Mycena venus TaxID=2733690 RepID=A0A8H6Y2P5_9AGAR|nr:RRM domain-containing protein [Mycena venus]
MAPRSFIRSRRDSARSSQARSPSPTFSDTTNISGMNFGPNGPEKIITRANLKASMQAYEDLMTTSSNYRSALVNLSTCTAAFANAMEIASGLKGPSYEAGTRLQAASGLHHLIGNHWHVLAQTLDQKFEKPLRQHMDTYKTIVAERSASYEKALKEKSQIIRDTEMKNMNRKERNLQSFREALGVLQRQVDELDDLKVAHYQEIMEHEEEVWDVVQNKICIVMRSTMDVFDKFTAKASDPVIEPMLQSIPDPFDSYGPPHPMPTPVPELEGLPAVSNSHVWMAPSPGTVAFPTAPPEWEDDNSPSSSTPPRSISPPFSNRKHLAPLNAARHPRKSESKLRSVLSPIDEARSRQASEDARAASIMNTLTPSPPPIETSTNHSWSFVYGNAQQDDSSEDRDGKTPTHSAFFPRSSTPPRPPLQNPGSDRSDPEMQVPIAT